MRRGQVGRRTVCAMLLGLGGVVGLAVKGWAWEPVGLLGSTRVGNTATLLSTGKVLVAGGFGSQGSPANYAELYNPATGTWGPASPMNSFRANHTATLLRNGKVLVAGGFDGSFEALASAEIYDPVSGTWTPTASMANTRVRHTATLLSNGRVLVAGGDVGADVLASCEVYHPATGTWTTTGSLNAARTRHTATRLPSGRVLAAGGSGPPTKSAELYNPQTGTWSFTGSMKAVRSVGHTATVLRTGKVLVAGGGDQSGVQGPQATAELYNPGTGTWSFTGSLARARHSHTATLLPDGRVIISGGSTPGSNFHDRQTEIVTVQVVPAANS